MAIRAGGSRSGCTMLRSGLALLGLGGAADLLYHALPPAAARALEPWLGPVAVNAHLLTFVGMIVVLAAVLDAGLRHGR